MMISVVIPLYNKEDSIARTINSVLGQNFDDYEIIIVNDGSTDNSQKVVQSFSDPRIRLINQPNSGVSVARNRGIHEARGKYIALLDGDDEWHSDYLSRQMALTRKYPECQIFITNYELRSANGDSRRATVNGVDFEIDGVLNDYFGVASQSEPPICSINIVAEKRCFEAIGGFPIDITNGEDLLTWARLAVKYKIAYSRRVGAIYNLKFNYGVNSKPVNIPQGNAVGDELEKLLIDYQGYNKSLRKYIGRWYKIRSHLFLRGGERHNAMKNIARAIKFKPTEWKIYIYVLMLPIPNKIINSIFKLL